MHYLDYKTELSKILETVTADNSSNKFLVNRNEFMTDLLNSIALDHTCKYLNFVYYFSFKSFLLMESHKISPVIILVDEGIACTLKFNAVTNYAKTLKVLFNTCSCSSDNVIEQVIGIM